MPEQKISFSVNEYDNEGDVSENGIYLHFGDTRVRVADDISGFLSFIDQINKIYREIYNNYPC